MKFGNVWLKYSSDEAVKADVFATRYLDFLSSNKTERECINHFSREALQRGFNRFQALAEDETSISKCFFTYMGKSAVFFRMGEKSIDSGLNILCAHVDSPRLDLKPNPLYTTDEFVYLDTQYYGGIKKYQWLGVPLALHGVVIKRDGTVIQVVIGENENDPVLGITDLLLHLSREQLEKRAFSFVDGEQLNLLAGSRPSQSTEEHTKTDPVLATLLDILKTKYDIDEEDFMSAELEAVPAYRAREFGLDRSMLIGYGHDDRACAFAAMEALFETPVIERPACVILVDKEEVGSIGATGMYSRNFENAIAELLFRNGKKDSIYLKRALCASNMLSCDVTSAVDPTFSDVFNSSASAHLGCGVAVTKYTGALGKSGSNDANAEYVSLLLRILSDMGIAYQSGDLGKVDRGGGNTIAHIGARFGMNVVDCGLPVLSMHSPHEIISKADLYEANKAYSAFLGRAQQCPHEI